MKIKLVLSILFIFTLVLLVFWKRNRNLNLLKTKSRVIGMVTLANYRNYEYQYKVAGKTYTHRKSNFSDGMRVGELYPVYYDSLDPNVCTIEHSAPIIVDSLYDETETTLTKFDIRKGIHVVYFSYSVNGRIYGRRLYVNSPIDKSCNSCSLSVKYRKSDPSIGYLVIR